MQVLNIVSRYFQNNLQGECITTKDRGTLTESMFYVLMSFLHQEMCGIEIAEFVEKKTNGRVRLGPGTLYTLLGKFQDEHLIEETQTDGRKRSYRITENGKIAFQDELARLKACVLDGEEENSCAK